MKFIHSHFFLWFILILPALPLIWDLYVNLRYYAEIMFLSGLWSIKFLVLSLAITPFSLLTKRWKWGRVISRWLLPRRRYFGVAAFGYAALHTLYYIRDVRSAYSIWLEAFDLPIFLGWLAVIVMFLLAITSNDYAIKKMGKGWKLLQRFSYLAAFGAFYHYYFFVDIPLDDFKFWLGVVIVAKVFHLGYRAFQKRGQRLRAMASKVQLKF